MEFTPVDAGVAVVVLISAVLAYSRGFTREVFALLGWAAAFVVAYFAAPMVDPLLREIPAVGPFLAQSCIISLIAAFTLVVAFVLLILSVFTPIIANAVLESALGGIDRILGFVYGVARGLVLVAVAYLIYANFAAPGTWPALEKAASRQLLDESARLVSENLPESIPAWFGEKVDALMVNCEGRRAPPAVTAPDAARPSAPSTPGGVLAPGAAEGGGTAGGAN